MEKEKEKESLHRPPPPNSLPTIQGEVLSEEEEEEKVEEEKVEEEAVVAPPVESKKEENEENSKKEPEAAPVDCVVEESGMVTVKEEIEGSKDSVLKEVNEDNSKKEPESEAVNDDVDVNVDVNVGKEEEKKNPIHVVQETTPKKKKKFGVKDFLFPPSHYDGGLFESFLVVGVPRKAAESDPHKVYDPEILYSFPPSDNASQNTILQSAAKFCFPEQLRVRKVVRTPSSSTLNQIIHGSDQAFSKRHVFCFNAVEDSYHWGICLVKEELLSMPLSFLGQLSSAMETINKAQSYLACERAYCLISRYPLFEAHYEILLSLLARERAYRFTISSNPPSSPALEELKTIFALKVDRNKDVELVLDLFSRHFDVELPLSKSNAFLDDHFAELIVQSTFPCLFQRLSLPNILRVFNAVALCKQVIIRSKERGVASAACLAVSMCCRPLRWEGILIPVLPESMKTVLSAPVPYLIGLSSPNIKLNPNEISVDGVVCDIDVDKVYIMSKYPLLPAYEQLHSNLKLVCGKSFSRTSNSSSFRNAFDALPEQKSTSLQCFVCFKSYTSWLTGKVTEHFKSSDPPPKNPKELRQSFLPGVTQQNRPFVDAFLSNQNFAVWCQSKFFE